MSAIRRCASLSVQIHWLLLGSFFQKYRRSTRCCILERLYQAIRIYFASQDATKVFQGTMLGMGYCLEAVIARELVLRELAATTEAAPIVPLDHNLSAHD
jgi:hypothetical protein